MRRHLRWWLPVLLVGWASDAVAEPLSLQAALQQAIERYPSVAEQQVSLDLAGIQYARAQFERANLQLGLTGGDNYSLSGITVQTSSQNVVFTNAAANLRLPLFTGWRITAGIERAGHGVTEREAELFATRQSLAMSVIDAYWGNQRAERIYAVNQAQVEQAQEIFDLAKARLAAGAIAPIDVNRAEVNLISAQAGLTRSDGQRQTAKARLANLLFRPDRDWTLSDEPAYRPIEGKPLPAWIDEAKENRPELAASRARQQARTADLTIARSRLWPELTASAQYQHGNNPFRPLSSANNVLSSFEGTFDGRLLLSYTLFDNAETWRQIREAELVAEQARLAYSRLERQIVSEVEQAHAQLKSAESRLPGLERSVAIAQNNRDIMAMRYKLGAAVITDVNDVQRALVSALTEHLEATIDYLVAVASLYQAVGRPLVSTDLPATRSAT